MTSPAPSTPQPVQPLAYSNLTDSAPRRLPSGFVTLTVVLGAALLLGYACSLLADVTGWGDPFYRKYRTPGMTIGVAPIWLLAATAVAHVLAGCLQLAGGLGCIGSPRAWARVLLAIYALLETTNVVNSYLYGWFAQQTSRSPLSTFEIATQALLRLASATPALGLPLLTLLQIRPRRDWPLSRA